MFKFFGPLIVVEDIARSRHFYEDCLGQTVQYDFGVNVAFMGNLSIHQKAHFQSLMEGTPGFAITPKANDGELYFETEDIAAAQARLKEVGAEFLHEIREQPWGQRCMRVYDPDGHILEIGEAMEAAVARMHQAGMTVEEICQKTGMPREFVEGALPA